MIIRREHKRNYTTVSNEVVDDGRLSYEALGLLTYLLSRPDDWEVKIDQLRARTKIGKEKIYRIADELKKAGYLSHQRVYEDGKVKYGFWIVREAPEEPLEQDSTVDDLDPEKPDEGDDLHPGNLDPENLRLEKPDVYKGLTGNKDSQEPKEREAAAETRETPFQRIVTNYPGVATDDIAKAKTQFDALPSEDRRAAEGALPKWRKFLEGQRRRPPLAEYLRDRKWTLIPDPKSGKAEGESELARSMVPPFDRAWWWLFFDTWRRFDAKEIRRQADLAKARIGWRIDPSKRDEIEEAGKQLVQIEVDGDAFKAWQRVVEDLPRPDKARMIFVPSVFPPKQQGVTAKEIAEAWPE